MTVSPDIPCHSQIINIHVLTASLQKLCINILQNLWTEQYEKAPYYMIPLGAVIKCNELDTVFVTFDDS
jgi:hypothetical protein